MGGISHQGCSSKFEGLAEVDGSWVVGPNNSWKEGCAEQAW